MINAHKSSCSIYDEKLFASYLAFVNDLFSMTSKENDSPVKDLVVMEIMHGSWRLAFIRTAEC